MSILVTSMIKIKDWLAWQELNRERLLYQASQAGALRYQIYRNVNDASQTLIVAEVAAHDAARELRKALGEVSDLLAGGAADERVWEPTGWEAIEPTGLSPPGGGSPLLH
jgi:hypothetical protein